MLEEANELLDLQLGRSVHRQCTNQRRGERTHETRKARGRVGDQIRRHRSAVVCVRPTESSRTTVSLGQSDRRQGRTRSSAAAADWATPERGPASAIDFDPSASVGAMQQQASSAAEALQVATVEALQAAVGAASPVFFFDYDGTLAPIVDEPEKAFISEECREMLRCLAATHPVALVRAGRIARKR